MKKYKVHISRDEYGYILVDAKNVEQARKIIESGEWNDDMFVLKSGSIIVDRVDTIA